MAKGIIAATFAAAGARLQVRSSAQYSAPWKLNILLILADDLGYSELGCQGCKDISTPNIDSIARAEVRFTQGYITCPICVPPRAGLLTGHYQQRFGFETNPGPEEYADEKFGLPLEQPVMLQAWSASGTWATSPS